MSGSAAQPLLALLALNAGGNPTQYMFEQAFSHHDLDWRYLTFEVSAERLGEAVRAIRVLGFRGGHLADPHKQAVLQWLDRVNETASVAGEANVILRDGELLVGDNIEGKAVMQAIGRKLDASGKCVVVFGTGAAARATALELARGGAEGITLVDRDEDGIGDFAAMLAGKHPATISTASLGAGYVLPADTELLIVTAGLFGKSDEERTDRSAEFWTAARPLVVDITEFSRTALLDEAADRGCEVIDGLSVLVERAAMGFQLWTGVEPNRQILREAAEEFLGL